VVRRAPWLARRCRGLVDGQASITPVAALRRHVLLHRHRFALLAFCRRFHPRALERRGDAGAARRCRCAAVSMEQASRATCPTVTRWRRLVGRRPHWSPEIATSARRADLSAEPPHIRRDPEYDRTASPWDRSHAKPCYRDAAHRHRRGSAASPLRSSALGWKRGKKDWEGNDGGARHDDAGQPQA